MPVGYKNRGSAFFLDTGQCATGVIRIVPVALGAIIGESAPCSLISITTTTEDASVGFGIDCARWRRSAHFYLTMASLEAIRLACVWLT